MTEVQKSNGGFSGTWHANTKRPYAVLFNGGYLRGPRGAVRTFRTREAAEKALANAQGAKS